MVAFADDATDDLTTCLPTLLLARVYRIGLDWVYLDCIGSGVQLRIHDSEGVDFYVLVASGPVIEDCSGLRFAPTGLRYSRYQHNLQVCTCSALHTMVFCEGACSGLRLESGPWSHRWCTCRSHTLL